MSPETASRKAVPRSLGWLAAILLLAAALRVLGLAWGLRHMPYHDEQYFVENGTRMVVARSLDHRFYEYPGLIFFLLYPVFLLARTQIPPGPEDYLAARFLIAGFGVLSVGLVYLLGRRLAGERVGLTAALLLAVSTLDVATAHTFRPDVVHQSLVLVAFLAFDRVGTGLKGDLLAGLALGAAIGAKFSGALLVPSYLARRWTTPGPRWRRTVLVGSISALVVLLVTPFAVLHFEQYLEGVRIQWVHHYSGEAVASRFGRWFVFHLRAIAGSLGPVGSLLAVGGMALVGRTWRRWLPLLVHSAVTVLVFSTADITYERFMMPTMGVFVLLAAVAAEDLRRRWRLGWLVLPLAALPPLWASAAYSHGLAQPGTWDRALEAVQAHVPDGARIACDLKEFGIDRRRYEVVAAPGTPDWDRLLARHVDLLVTGRSDPAVVSGLREVFRAGPTPDFGPIALFAVPDGERLRYREVPLAVAMLSASENEALLPRVLDDDPGTTWLTLGEQRPGAWIQVDLEEPTLLARVELGLGRRPARSARELSLLVSRDGREWEPLASIAGRPRATDQSPAAGEASDLLLFQPVAVRGIRLVQMGTADRRWGVARLSLGSPLPEPGN